MMDTLMTTKQDALTINRHSNYDIFNLTREARDKIKALSDQEFEKELKNFDPDTQIFLRLARE